MSWTVRVTAHATGKQGRPTHYYNEFKSKRNAEMFARKVTPELRAKGYSVKGVLITNQKIGPK